MCYRLLQHDYSMFSSYAVTLPVEDALMSTWHAKPVLIVSEISE